MGMGVERKTPDLYDWDWCNDLLVSGLQLCFRHQGKDKKLDSNLEAV